jgi:endonuclease/exonuclease/phosphatase family metal-dependent hydrolase
MTTCKIMSLNLMRSLPINRWERKFENRAASIEELVRWHQPDLIGVQELTEEMLPKLAWLEENYIFYGRSRTDGGDDERCCVLCRRDRFDLLSGETFWLSSTPSQEGSRMLTSVCPRIAVTALLRDRESGVTFTFCNTHLDFLLPTTRTGQAEILRQQLIARSRGAFLAVTGDFNSGTGSEAIRALIGDSNPLQLKDIMPADAGSTLHDPIGSISHGNRPIDHIFLSEQLEVRRSIVIRSKFMGVFPSDHFPVLAEFEMPQP